MSSPNMTAEIRFLLSSLFFASAAASYPHKCSSPGQNCGSPADYDGPWVAAPLSPMDKEEIWTRAPRPGGFVRHGQGSQTFPNGVVYNGSWFNDQFHGQGFMRWPDSGAVYDGGWVEDLREGLGEYPIVYLLSIVYR